MKNRFTIFLVALLLAAPLLAGSRAAHADGKSGGGESSGGESSGGSSTGGGDGGGDDNDGGDDGGGTGSGSGSGGSSSGSGSSSSGNSSSGTTASQRSDTDNVQNAVKRKQAVPLGALLSFVKTNYDGKVINVELKNSGKQFVYQVKLFTSDNKLRIIKLDALQLTDSNTASLY